MASDSGWAQAIDGKLLNRIHIREGRRGMRTSREQLRAFMELDADQLRAMPPRIIRDWLLDLADAIGIVKKVLKYEDVLASRISGEQPPSLDFKEISDWLADHGDHVGITELPINGRCYECGADWTLGILHLGCAVCGEVVKETLGTRFQIKLTDQGGNPVNATRSPRPGTRVKQRV